MASPAPAPGGGRFLGLRPRTALIIGGVALAGGVGYFWWRRRTAKTATSSASVSASAYGVDQSGELSVIQAELEQLLSQEGQPVASGGGGGTPGGGGSGSGSGDGSGTGTGTGTGGKPKGSGGSGGPGKPAMPTGVHATKVTSTSVTLAWHKAPGATSYRIHVTYQGKRVHDSSTQGNSATVSGLTPDHTYTFHVASVGPGGTSAETNGPAVKTSR